MSWETSQIAFQIHDFSNLCFGLRTSLFTNPDVRVKFLLVFVAHQFVVFEKSNVFQRQSARFVILAACFCSKSDLYWGQVARCQRTHVRQTFTNVCARMKLGVWMYTDIFPSEMYNRRYYVRSVWPSVLLNYIFKLILNPWILYTKCPWHAGAAAFQMVLAVRITVIIPIYY